MYNRLIFSMHLARSASAMRVLMREVRSFLRRSNAPLILLILATVKSAPACAGDGVLAYTWQPLSGGLHEIHVINIDGTGERLLIDAPIGLNHHEWSPDARRIATVGYIGTNNATWSIHVVEAEGDNPQRLTQLSDVWDSEPTWSPDGLRIAFCRIYPEQGFRSEMWVMNADGSNQHWIDQLGFAPKWSPDGSRFVYQTSLNGDTDIHTCAINGSDVQVVYTSPASDGNPAWSPNGEKIVFTRQEGADLSSREIWVMNADGSGPVPLTDNSVYDDMPRWSPDGGMLAFHSELPGQVEIHVMNADGSDIRRVTTVPAGVTAINPSWCPTLSGPYLGQTEPDMALERFPPFPFIANPIWFWHGAPAFSPDGLEMSWARYEPGNGTAIYMTEIQDGNWTWPRRADFSSGLHTDNCPVFSSTGDTLYFQSSRPGGNIFRVERMGDTWTVPVPLALPLPAGTNPGLQFSVARNGDLYGEVWNINDGDGDLYRWQLLDGVYGDPEELGPNVNSPAFDFMPFVDPNQQFLIFVSDRPDGSGDSDIWLCARVADGGWSDPINAGQEINTGDPDLWPHLSPDGNFLFVTSGHEGDQGFNPYWMPASALLDQLVPVEKQTWGGVKSLFR